MLLGAASRKSKVKIVMGYERNTSDSSYQFSLSRSLNVTLSSSHAHLIFSSPVPFTSLPASSPSGEPLLPHRAADTNCQP